MIKKKDRTSGEVNASSMADIAFLLLIFFIITSSVVNDKGVRLKLPILQDPEPVETLERNACLIIMNSKGDLLVRGKEMGIDDVSDFVKKFILNNGKVEDMSVSPKDAVVVFKSSRGSNYSDYIKLINRVQISYFDLWALKAGISTDDLMAWDVDNDETLSRNLDKLREEIPYNFVVAETEK